MPDFMRLLEYFYLLVMCMWTFAALFFRNVFINVLRIPDIPETFFVSIQSPEKG